MDDFEFGRPELASTLMTMEFGEDGRIHQLWATDPGLPEEGEDFQFVLPPIQFGEEGADDYYPGTILMSVRSDPDEPWASSRNSGAKMRTVPGFGEAEEGIVFEYEFPFIDGLEVTGRFYEQMDGLPQVVWDVEIKNTGRKTLEVGELGFPFALNNYFDGFGWNDEQLTRLWQSRVYLHKFVGGGASWLFAQRMTALSPGLLVYPGENTGWEFFNHVPGSLSTPHQWEGIPVFYVYSKATIEREEWPTWFNEHTSLILEPGDSRKIQTRFVATESDKFDGVHHTLSLCNRPTIRVLPSAVAPADIGIGVEVAGTAVKKFFVSREAETEVDLDESGGFCFVRPREAGPMIVSFQNGEGVMCHAHLMFVDPIEDLIKRRAAWLTKFQTVGTEGGALNGAIVPAEMGAMDEPPIKLVDPTDYAEPSGLECSLGDALFLAEKCAIYPVREEVMAIDKYVEEFLLQRVQNPGNGAVASVLVDGVPAYFGRPMTYPSVANLYFAMYKIANGYGEVSRTADDYLRLAGRTIEALFEHGWRLYVRSVGVMGFSRIYEIERHIRQAGMTELADSVRRWIDFKSGELVKMKYPFAGETVMDTSGFEEVAAAARYQDDDDHLERTIRCAFATRSLAPSWWWYGSDKRHGDLGESNSQKAVLDRGELCLGHTTIPNSMIFFGLMDRDYLALPDAYVRLAFGGMLGPWALIRSDGASSMCYCPDLSSKQAGYNRFTGPGGHGYAHYLIGAASYVLPSRTQDGYSFGCHAQIEGDMHIVRPWDGVGRRIVMRQIGVEFEMAFGVIRELRLDLNLRWFELVVENPADKSIDTELSVRGMWGRELGFGEQVIPLSEGVFRVPVAMEPGRKVIVSGRIPD